MLLQFCRLKLTPTPRTKRTRQRTTEIIETDSGKKKKRRVEHDDVTSANVSTSASGFIQIIDVDPKGNFVQIKNMSDQVGSLVLLVLNLTVLSDRVNWRV